MVLSKYTTFQHIVCSLVLTKLLFHNTEYRPAVEPFLFSLTLVFQIKTVSTLMLKMMSINCERNLNAYMIALKKRVKLTRAFNRIRLTLAPEALRRNPEFGAGNSGTLYIISKGLLRFSKIEWGKAGKGDRFIFSAVLLTAANVRKINLSPFHFHSFHKINWRKLGPLRMGGDIFIDKGAKHLLIFNALLFGFALEKTNTAFG